MTDYSCVSLTTRTDWVFGYNLWLDGEFHIQLIMLLSQLYPISHIYGITHNVADDMYYSRLSQQVLTNITKKYHANQSSKITTSSGTIFVIPYS